MRTFFLSGNWQRAGERLISLQPWSRLAVEGFGSFHNRTDSENRRLRQVILREGFKMGKKIAQFITVVLELQHLSCAYEDGVHCV